MPPIAVIVRLEIGCERSCRRRIAIIILTCRLVIIVNKKDFLNLIGKGGVRRKWRD